MIEGKDNVIMLLSKRFALKMVRLYGVLRDEQHEYVMSKQVYRSGTSIGANIAESIFAQSDADFVNKLSIALKEAAETLYWLELLHEAGKLQHDEFVQLEKEIKTIIGTLVKIINKMKAKRNKE